MSIERIDSIGQRFEFPDDATEGEINVVMGEHEAALTAQGQSSAPRQGQVLRPNTPSNVPFHLQPLTPNEAFRSGAVPRFIEGVVSPATALAEVGMLGPDLKKYANEYQHDREMGMLKKDEVNVAGGLGQVVGSFGPIGLAAKLGQGAGMAARIAKPLTGYVGGGALVSGLTPTGHGGEDDTLDALGRKTGQVLTGGALGLGVKGLVNTAGKFAPYIKDRGQHYLDSYSKGGGERMINRELLKTVPKAEQAALASEIEHLASLPENEGLTTAQLLRGAGKGAPLVQALDDVAQKTGEHSTWYRDQLARITEAPGKMFSKISAGGSPQIDIEEKAAKKALSDAFEATKQTPGSVNAASVVREIDKGIAEASATTNVIDAQGVQKVSSGGKAVLKSTGEPIADDLISNLNKFRDKLFTTDTIDDFTSKLRGTAESYPSTAKGAKALGLRNSLDRIINELPKNGFEGTTTRINDLVATMKSDLASVRQSTKMSAADRAKVENEILDFKRVIDDVRSQLRAGPTHITDNARTVIGVRSEIANTIKKSTPHEAKVLGDLKGTIDKVLARMDPKLGQALLDREAASTSFGRRRVAEAIERASQDASKEVTPRLFLKAVDDPQFVRKHSGLDSMKTMEDVLSNAELKELAKQKAGALGVSRAMPNYEPVGDAMNVSPIPGAPGRISLMARELARYGTKRVMPDIEKRVQAIAENPQLAADLLKGTPPNQRGRVVDALMKAAKATTNNELVRQTVRTAPSHLSAELY